VLTHDNYGDVQCSTEHTPESLLYDGVK